MDHVIRIIHQIADETITLETSNHAYGKLDRVQEVLGQVPQLDDEIRSFNTQVDDAICMSLDRTAPPDLLDSIERIVRDLRNNRGINLQTLPTTESTDGPPPHHLLTQVIQQLQTIIRLVMSDSEFIQNQLNQMFTNVSRSIYVIRSGCWYVKIERAHMSELLKEVKPFLKDAANLLFESVVSRVLQNAKKEQHEHIKRLIKAYKDCSFLILEVKVADLVEKENQEDSVMGRILGSWENTDKPLNLDEVLVKLKADGNSFPQEWVSTLRNLPGQQEKCSLHTETPIVVACEKCYHPMCLKCIDRGTGAKQCSDEGTHQARSIEQVAEKIKDEIEELSSKLRVRELVNADDLKKRQKTFDEQTEQNREDLGKLAAKVAELQKMIDDFDQKKKNLVTHMNEKKLLLRKWEKEIEDYQQTCSQVHNETSRFMKMNSEVVVKDQRRVKELLSSLSQFKLRDDPQSMSQMLLIIKDETINLPIRLERIPTSIVYKGGRKTPSGKSIYTVQYTNNGHLLDAGINYHINGLNFTPQISTGDNGFSYSLFEHKSLLYVLQYSNYNYYVDVLNLLTYDVQQSVITYSGASGYWEKITANDEYIIVTDYQSKSVKVYSTKTHVHQFDIKHECFNNRPRGVAFLDNTIVVGDHNKHQVSNITISESPELIWPYTDIQNPTSIRVCQDSQMILVAAPEQKQIHVLSCEGKRLTVLDVLQCGDIYDISLYKNQLAIADFSPEVKIYELKTDTK